jgi:hypothetical protein
MARGIKPTRQQIIDGIKEALDRGDDLRTSAVQKTSLRWLYRGSEHYFKNWGAALKAAGSSYEEVKKRAEEPKVECNVNVGKKYTCGGGAGCFYGIGFIGALVYYLSTATSFWDGVLGVIKALLWPGFLVYELLHFLGA